MWIYCDICGAVVALVDLHTAWHVARGDSPPEPTPEPDPTPEEVAANGDQRP